MAFSWFKRRRLVLDAPRLRPRRERNSAVAADLAAVAPDLRPFLGLSASVQLSAFERLSALVADAPGYAAKEAIGQAAAHALTRHERLVSELRRFDLDPDTELREHLPRVAALDAATAGHDWPERVLSAHIVGGLLDDFFAELAQGVPSDGIRELPAVFAVDPADRRMLEALLAERIDADAVLASRLAMWGRRLVGDTLLLSRSILRLTGDVEVDDAHTAPLYADIIAAHTRRMDALGLTA
ncbi:MAG: ferritin-like domain-containing protein [Microbacteriaceae bacterium]|nr:ferritin-like domain-containing protein [Nocardioidaceae bacterium]MCL2794115.1 ferritin-like domain-containing protein [Microbacteriaceae bacterium]